MGQTDTHTSCIMNLDNNAAIHLGFLSLLSSYMVLHLYIGESTLGLLESIPGAEISRLLFINFPAVSYLSACLMNLQYKKVCFFTESEILWKLSLGVALTFSIIIFFYCFSSSLGLSIFFRPMSALLFASVKRKYWNFTYECYQISKGKQLLISFNCLR